MSYRTRPLTFLALAGLLLAALPAAAAESGQVNINTATAEQLQLLPRVGPTVAQRIIEFRDDNGNFKSTADLMLVRGIGEKTFEKIEPYVALAGDTTLQEKVSTADTDDDRG